MLPGGVRLGVHGHVCGHASLRFVVRTVGMPVGLVYMWRHGVQTRGQKLPPYLSPSHTPHKHAPTILQQSWAPTTFSPFTHCPYTQTPLPTTASRVTNPSLSPYKHPPTYPTSELGPHDLPPARLPAGLKEILTEGIALNTTANLDREAACGQVRERC